MVKKIIMSLYYPDNLKRIIIVKDNEIIRYTNQEVSQLKLKEIYSKYVSKLKEENKDILEGLNNQEKINKLANLGKIERNENNLIINIEYYEEDKKIIINYENGYSEQRIINDYIFKDIIFNLCKTYDIDLNEKSIDKLELLGLIKKVKKENKLENVIKQNKIKKLRIKKRFLSSILALGMISGVIGGIRLYKKSSQDIVNNNQKIYFEMTLPKETPYDELLLDDKVKVEIDKKSFDESLFKSKVNEFVKDKKIYEYIKCLIALKKIDINMDDINQIIKDNILLLKPNNLLNNVQYSSYLSTMNVNNEKFITVSTKKGYTKILSEKGKQSKDGCFEYSISYADGIFKDSKSFSKSGIRMDKNVVVTENEQKILQIMAKELLEGRTSIIMVNGLKGGRHFVLVVGLKENYNKDELKQSDFLIADPASASLKILNTDFGGKKRYLLKVEDDKNWNGYDGISSGYMIALANNYEEYISNDVEQAVVPWITYVPESKKKIKI